MARVNVEQKALTDGRFRTLGRGFGVRMALAHATGIGLMILVWNQCQERERETLTAEEIDGVLGIRGAWQKLIDADLGEQTTTGEIRVRGTSGRIEWLASRRSEGRLAKGGGRPRKTPTGSEKETPGGLPQKTPLSPAPAPTTSKDTSLHFLNSDRKQEPKPLSKGQVLYLADQIRKWANERAALGHSGDADAYERAFKQEFQMAWATWEKLKEETLGKEAIR